MSQPEWIAKNEFPYECFVSGDWKGEALKKVIALSSDPHIRGVCVIVGSAHGYALENQIILGKNGYAQGEAWSDLAKSVGACPVQFDYDLDVALTLLEGPWRARDVANGSAPDATRGRSMAVFVAVGQRGSYLTCQSPLLEASAYDDLDSFILRVWRAFELPEK